MQKLIDRIKESEGFSEKPYIDVLVKKNPENYGISKRDMKIIEENFDKLKVTFGYGSTFITRKGAELNTIDVLGVVRKDLIFMKPIVIELPEEKQDVLIDMAYNMGVPRLLKFKKMWSYLEVFDFDNSAIELLDSRYARQVPNRASENARILKKIL